MVFLRFEDLVVGCIRPASVFGEGIVEEATVADTVDGVRCGIVFGSFIKGLANVDFGFGRIEVLLLDVARSKAVCGSICVKATHEGVPIDQVEVHCGFL